MKYALLSVFDKTGIVEFAKSLVALNFKLIASGGTARKLMEAGLEVLLVQDLVGGDEILGHRVVTLSREVHAGLLARQIDTDIAELKKLGVPFIDLVCVDCYPLRDAVADPEATLESVIESTDIGGPTMLRSAAKGNRIVLCKNEQRQQVIDWLLNEMPDHDEFVNQLAATAEGYCADYILESARYRSGGKIDGMIGTQWAKGKGENDWQGPAQMMACETDDELALHRFEQVAGSQISGNNWIDFDRLLQTMTHAVAVMHDDDQPTPAIALGVKHGNCCGAAVGAPHFERTNCQVLELMLMGDPEAIFGGVLMVTFPIGKEEAETILHYDMRGALRRLTDGIAAPGFSPEAIEMIKRKGGRCRMIVNPMLAKLTPEHLDHTPVRRPVRGGFLQQGAYDNVLGEFHSTRPDALHVYSIEPYKRSLRFAWAIGSTSNSNTITIVKDGQLIGNGTGLASRVRAARLAVRIARKGRHDIKGAVAYSDSFFPFTDGPEVLVEAGCRAIFASSGSVRDKDVVAFCRGHNVKFFQLPDSDIRGFFNH